MLAPLAALALSLTPLAAQTFAGVPDLAGQLSGLRFTRTPDVAAASVPGKPVTPAETPDVSPFAVRGIDVSIWQGVIDWPTVAKSGVSFTYLKATESVDFVDEQFARNWAGAKKAGLLRGAYHFWDFCSSGGAQAAHFIKTVPRDGAALPMTIDLEESRGCRAMPSKEKFQKSLAAFLAKVEKAYGLKPVLYVNLSIYEQYLAGADHGLKIWIADPHDKAPKLPAGVNWAMWQYSWKGRLPGINDSEVDLDVFNGTPEQLAALTRPGDGGVMFASR